MCTFLNWKPDRFRLYAGRRGARYHIVLTRFDRSGNSAKIDGYFQQSGYRSPLMSTDIVKESDGHWRWAGNQK
jgi:hypothetical protein